MSISATLGSQSFGAPSSSGTARQLLGEKVNGAVYDKRRFHVPGVDGNYIVRCGRKSQLLVYRLRYFGSVANVADYMATDYNKWATESITIEDSGGNSHNGCNLTDDGFKVIGEMRPAGRATATNVYVDVEATFTVDA